MIVANLPYGRLGNQLDLAAHLITICEVYGKTISLQYLEGRADDFPYFDGSPMRVYPSRRRHGPWFEKIAARVINSLIQRRLISQIDFLTTNEWVYFDDPAFSANPELVRLNRAWLCTLKVWRLRSRTRIHDHRALIRQVFTPRLSILEAGRQSIASLDCEVVIGVHIRWGDYKTAAPELYYDAAVYRERMLEEGRDIEAFSDLTCVFPKADAVTDLYALAQSDYLIAPSSTFSTWASYWGGVGLYTILNRHQPIVSLDDFVTSNLVVDY